MSVTYRCQGSKQLAQGCAQTSTNTLTVITDSELDARGWQSVQYTIAAYDNAIKYAVYAANASTFVNEICVQAATTVLVGASGTFAETYAAFGWYRLKLIDDVLNTHGNVTVTAKLQG